MLRVLAVTSFVPYPADRGDPVRVMGILHSISKKCDLTVWSVNSTAVAHEKFRRALKDATIEVFPVDEPASRSKLRDARRLVRCIVSGVPFWIAKRRSSALMKSLRALRPTDFDSTIFLGEAAGWYAQDYQYKWHWDKFNVLSESTRYEVEIASGVAAKFLAQLNRIATMRFERRICARAGTVSVTNDAENTRLNKCLGRPADLILPSVVPVRETALNFNLSAKNALWLGNFNYFSNRDGLRKFLACGWPELRCAGWTLYVVGSGLSDEMRFELARVQSARTVGYVEDIAEVARMCTLGIVPIWSGGGTKMKTLTMLAMGLPVVSTPMGFEGIPNDGYPLADSPTEIAELAIELHRSGKLELMAERGRRLALDFFSQSAGLRYADELLCLIGGRA